jgi:hypothetical protein
MQPSALCLKLSEVDGVPHLCRTSTKTEEMRLETTEFIAGFSLRPVGPVEGRQPERVGLANVSGISQRLGFLWSGARNDGPVFPTLANLSVYRKSLSDHWLVSCGTNWALDQVAGIWGAVGIDSIT